MQGAYFVIGGGWKIFFLLPAMPFSASLRKLLMAYFTIVRMQRFLVRTPIGFFLAATVPFGSELKRGFSALSLSPCGRRFSLGVYDEEPLRFRGDVSCSRSCSYAMRGKGLPDQPRLTPILAWMTMSSSKAPNEGRSSYSLIYCADYDDSLCWVARRRSRCCRYRTKANRTPALPELTFY